ncbi:cation/H+ exchanger [Stereum hirsutum FP-91666 SS1]|uniref:cation/H+ exchanger n=1 Tax=Stereum hirsutum (strain FP-91666) TaxID=721885 RepID=UPI00044498AB|nr:cation/H+ exchanger [Stereum hirsutum FP-91666 SS1]EIM85679.1 cation/H+ exchanger [Stereum hirsutum FP-91666 SS1]
MGHLSARVQAIALSFTRRDAPEQAGIFAGLNPAAYNTTDPFPLWVIQTVIIIGMTQLLALFLSRIRQPRVIAEVIGGVLLGPTVMGRIPNFTNTIFPKDSLTMLTLTSTIGLVMFLFLVGIEIDMSVVKRNAKASAAISAAGLIIPLGLGAAIAIPIYHEFTDPSVNYGYFILFVAVAVGITVFPVLCRILTETKLLDTTVGVLVLSAGVGNDVVGWILLALTVALVNASTGLVALYVLLTGVGFALFLLLPVKWAYVWLARWTGSLETGQPTTMMTTITLVIVAISAFFTDVIGIHPIFGGFLAGLIIPKENGYAISLVERFEDFVGLLLLPQYFALSGLKTDLGLLDNGITWGYTILLCVVAFFAKFLSCSLSAKAFGFNLRESGAVGTLMACKGLVELIVLNVGLSANILNTRVFSMFVLHALVLTFVTTPLTLWIYPMSARGLAVTVPAAGDGLKDEEARKNASEEAFKTKFSVVLDKLEQLSSVMTFAQLLQRPTTSAMTSTESLSSGDDKSSTQITPAVPTLSHSNLSRSRKISLDALRLVELTERTSALLKSQASESMLQQDPVLSIFRTFARLNRFSESGSLSVVSHDEYAMNIAEHAREHGSQMVIIPWAPSSSTTATVAEDSEPGPSVNAPYNPFDMMFNRQTSSVRDRDQTTSSIYTGFVRKVFASSPTDVALFVDRGICAVDDGADADIVPHVFLPFFGGPDDRLALTFLVQLCVNESLRATVVRLRKTEGDDDSSIASVKKAEHSTYLGNSIALPDTIYGRHDTTTKLQSDTADNILWSRLTSPTAAHNPEVTSSLTRISLSEESTPRPLHRAVEIAAAGEFYTTVSGRRNRNVVVMLGRSRRMAVESHEAELRQIVSQGGNAIGSEARKALGDVAAAFVMARTNASLLVVQACHQA